MSGDLKLEVWGKGGGSEEDRGGKQILAGLSGYGGLSEKDGGDGGQRGKSKGFLKETGIAMLFNTRKRHFRFIVGMWAACPPSISSNLRVRPYHTL
jgi:hypothetical protein